MTYTDNMKPSVLEYYFFDEFIKELKLPVHDPSNTDPISDQTNVPDLLCNFIGVTSGGVYQHIDFDEWKSNELDEGYPEDEYPWLWASVKEIEEKMGNVNCFYFGW
jgi:hypothetical protein